MAESFAARFGAVRSAQGPLVCGLDPSGDLLDGWRLGDTPDGLDRFADIMLEAVTGAVGLIKPQSAFYERHGWRGIRTLQRLVYSARAAGLLVILDIKRGDVGSTNDAYAEAYLGKGAPLAADAITVHPYLGLGAMGTFVSRAEESGSCVLVVTRSSNPEGRAVQAALARPGNAATGGTVTVEEELLRDIGALNERLAPGRIGPVGAVVGPTHLSPRLDLAAANCLFLAPACRRAGRDSCGRGDGVRRLPGPGDAERLPVPVVGRTGLQPPAGRVRGARGRLPCSAARCNPVSWCDRVCRPLRSWCSRAGRPVPSGRRHGRRTGTSSRRSRRARTRSGRWRWPDDRPLEGSC
jgi:orotidine-5'-phosphate decarboxylase